MKLPDISVVVPHYENLDGLADCMTALERQTLTRDRFEIIVCDNMSPSGLARVREVVGDRARLVSQSEKGAGPARNAGASAARARLLAFTDSDCIPEPDWLTRGIAALEQTDIAGGRMTVLVPHHRPMSGAEAFEAVFAFDNKSYIEDKGFTVTANLFCSRAVFDAVGPFKTGVSEDVEWCRRAATKGFRLDYAEASVVGHPARRDWNELKRKWARMNAENFHLICTQPFGRVKWLARNVVMPASALAHAHRVLRSRSLPDSRSRIRALATLARLRFWRAADGIALAMNAKE